MKKKIYKALAILCSCAFAIGAYQLISTYHNYSESDKMYDNIKDVLVSANDQEHIEVSGPEKAADQVPIKVNFEELKAINEDVVGWVYSEDSNINYPILQGDDNLYYLHNAVNNTLNRAGSIYMDANNSPDFTDANTIIYGHNLSNNSMFSSLDQYMSPTYFNGHRNVYILTEDKNYRVDIFSGYMTNPTSKTFTINFDSPEQYMDYLKYTWASSDVKCGDVPMTEDDNIVTLATCSNSGNNVRYVVHGKLVELD